MSSRVERVIDDTRIAIGKTRLAAIPIPRGTSFVQVVLDRTRFEAVTNDRSDVCRIEIFVDDEYGGGASWAGGVTDLRRESRPGSRMLWSFGRWSIPSGSRSLRVEVNAPKRFSCLLDVDFLD